MPSRSRTQVIGRISWVIPCILHYKYNKDKTFLIFEFTSLSKEKCGKRTNHTKKRFEKIFQTHSREIRNSRVPHIHKYYNIGLSESSTPKGSNSDTRGKRGILLQQPGYNSSSRLQGTLQMYSKASST
jgi:hypothetical protein